VDRRSLIASMCVVSALAADCRHRTQGITLGLYGSMTGTEADFGIATRNGVQLAVDEQNAHGGVAGQRVGLTYEDTRGDSNEAASAVTRLIDRGGAIGILGEVASALSIAGGRIAQRRHVPMISPSSTNVAVTQVGDYVFRAGLTDPFIGQAMARYARGSLHFDRVAILEDRGSPYSTGLADAFQAAFTAGGGTIVDVQSYRASDTHFSAQLGSILSHQPQAIFVPGYYGQVYLIAREARGLGYRGPFLGGDGWSGAALWLNDEDALVGSFFAESFAPDRPRTPRGQHFVSAYRARFNTQPNGLAALGYDAALLMMDALQRSHGAGGVALRDAIAATHDFDGATGSITMGADRNAIKSAVVLGVDANGTHFVGAIEPAVPMAQ
jgi:branched-chain amino acid transport system substrate-binding protein